MFTFIYCNYVCSQCRSLEQPAQVTFEHSSSTQVIRRSVQNDALKSEMYEDADTASKWTLEYFHSGKKAKFLMQLAFFGIVEIVEVTFIALVCTSV